MPKAPNVPTGPKSSSRGASKPMTSMPKAKPSKPGAGKPGGSSSVSPKKQGQTVDGGPKK